VILQKRPPGSLPTAPASLDQATGSSRSPMTGDARRWALWSVEGVSTQATPGWIPRFTGKKILPREITRQEKSAGEGGSGEGRARGGLQRENTGLQSSLPRELLTESPPVAAGAVLLSAAVGVSTRRRRSGWPRPPSCRCSTAAPPSRSEMVWARR
jgi:hypothetical protein